MYFRTFFFILFIVTAIFFFLASFNPKLALSLYSSISPLQLSIKHIQLTLIVASSISIILYLITNYYTKKSILKEKEKLKRDRLNIEEIHAELEELKV